MDFKLGFNSSNNNSNNSNNSSSERSSGSISKCRPPPAPDSSTAMPSKLPRTDSSFSNGQQQHQHQQQQQQQNRTSNSSGSKIGPCSPTDSSTEDSIHVPISSSSPAPSIQHQQQQQQQQQQNDQCSLLMPPPPTYQMGNPRPQQHQHHQQQQPLVYQQYKQPGLHLGSPLLGLADVFMGPRYPFTALQWAELEHQALVFKYILARAPIPPELVAPIRNSLLQQQSGWGSSSAAGGGTASGFAGGATTGIHTNHLDAEPGRCRRTDGKKWRCARPIVPDQKYCERHINRGRHKKKSGAAASSSGPINSNNPSAETAGTNPAAAAAAGGTGSNELLPSNHHHHHHHHSQFLDASVVKRGSDQQQQQQQQHYSIQQQTNQQQQQQQQMMMLLRGNQNSGGSGFNTNSTSSSNNVSQFQGIPLQSGYNSIPSGAGSAGAEGTLSMKDRFLNGISKATSFDLRPEQLLFSEVSGGTRSSVTLQHHHQNQNQSQNHHHQQHQQYPPNFPTGTNRAGPVPTIPTTSGQVLQDQHHQVPAVQIQQQQQQQQQQVKSNSSTSSNPESPYYSYSKLFIPSDETEHCLSTLLPPNQNQHQNFHQHHHPHQQQQQNQQQQSYYLADLAAVDRKPDTSQALRQLFNDWPRSRDASTMTSWSDSDENNNNHHDENKDGLRAFKSKTTNNSKMSSYSTHLSISIPASTTETTTTTTTTTTGSDHDQAANTTTNNVAAAAHNDLRLCMGSFFCGDDVADSATNNPSKSSLIGSSSSGSVELGWFSAARASVGGPLAEAFNASEVKSAGFSFLLGGSPAAAPAGATQHVVSPTGVLQKATLGSFSESSSSASSPGSIKVDQLH